MSHKQAELDQADEWRRPKTQKDTAHWCRGHVGREHLPMVVLSVGPYRQDCGMQQSYKTPGHMVWHCSHIVKCEDCGKVIEALPTDDCPAKP